MYMAEVGSDETIICKFRNYLVDLDLADQLFERVNKQFEKKELVGKKETIVIVSFYQAATWPNSKEEAKDFDASWGTKGKKKYYYGYKFHIGMDQKSCLIRKTEVTTAMVSDYEVFEELLSGDEAPAYGDKACYSKKREEELEAKGIFNDLIRKGARNESLSDRD